MLVPTVPADKQQRDTVQRHYRVRLEYGLALAVHGTVAGYIDELDRLQAFSGVLVEEHPHLLAIDAELVQPVDGRDGVTIQITIPDQLSFSAYLEFFAA